MEVIEDVDSTPHNLARYEVRCKKESQDVRMLKAPKPLQGASGGELPTVEKSERNAKTRGGLKGSAK